MAVAVLWPVLLINTTIPLHDLHVAGGGQVQLTPTRGADWLINPGAIRLWLVNPGVSGAPVKFQNGAPSNSLVVAPSGRIGFGDRRARRQHPHRRPGHAGPVLGHRARPRRRARLQLRLRGVDVRRSSGFFDVSPDAQAIVPNPSLRFATANVQRMVTSARNRLRWGSRSRGPDIDRGTRSPGVSAGASRSAGPFWPSHRGAGAPDATRG
jgi:hypothetical protein